MSAAEKIISRLTGVKQVGKRREWWALCPAHGEDTPSLHVTETDDGRVLLHCFGCQAGGADIVEKIGLSVSDLFSGAHGEFFSKPYRKPEEKLYKSGYEAMQDEIYRLRAKAGVK